MFEALVVVEVMTEAMVVVEVLVVGKAVVEVEVMIEAMVVVAVEVLATLEGLAVVDVVLLVSALEAGTLTLSERVQRQAGLTRLDGEQALSLQVEQMLLLDLLDLQELLLEGQLLRRHLLLMACTHTCKQTHKKYTQTQMERQQGTPLVNIIIHKSRANTQKPRFRFAHYWTLACFQQATGHFSNPLRRPRHNPHTEATPPTPSLWLGTLKWAAFQPFKRHQVREAN